jgi:hypothetical protein
MPGTMPGIVISGARRLRKLATFAAETRAGAYAVPPDSADGLLYEGAGVGAGVDAQVDP